MRQDEQLEHVHGLDDERIARAPVMTVAGEQTNADRVAAGHELGVNVAKRRARELKPLPVFESTVKAFRTKS